MKKIVFTILVCGIIVLELTGCNNLKQKQKDDIHSFVGTIIKCEEKSMIVRPNENEEEYNSSDKFRIKYIDGFDSCKSKDKNVTMIICNTIKNDKNILIGDYSMEYVEGDCKN